MKRLHLIAIAIFSTLLFMFILSCANTDDSSNGGNGTTNPQKTGKIDFVSVIPNNGATGVPANSKIEITFSDILDFSVIGTIELGDRTFTNNEIEIENEKIIVTPSNGFLYNTKYEGLTISGFKGILNEVVNNYSNSSYNFKTEVDPDDANIKVSTISPIKGSGGVTKDTKIIITFSGNLDTNTKGTVIFSGKTFSPSEIVISNNVVTITPTVSFNYLTTYSNISISGFKSHLGDNIDAYIDAAYSFTTIADPDSPVANFDSIKPASNEINVATSSKIEIYFTGLLDTETKGTVTIGARSYSGNEISISGTTVTITPSSKLDYGNKYSGLVISGFRSSLAPNTLMTPVNDAAYNFTTCEKPKVSSITPVKSATNVSIDSNIVITMDTNIASTIGVVAIGDRTFSGSEISVSGKIITVNPTNDFGYYSTYTDLSITGFKSSFGEDVIISDPTYSFTTCKETKITYIDPGSQAVDLATNHKLKLTFSIPLDSSVKGNIKIGDKLIQSSEIAISGSDVTVNTTYEEGKTYTGLIVSGFKGMGSMTMNKYEDPLYCFTIKSTSSTTSSTTTTTIPYDGVVIYYKQTSGTPKIWVWELSGKEISTTMGYTWPGPEMQAVAGKTGWYKFEIPASKLSTPAKELRMKFNGGGSEIARTTPVKTGWYNGTTWSDECPDLPEKPSISLSPIGGTLKGTEKITITITSEIAVTNRSVTFGSTSVPMTSNSIQITLSDYLTNGETKTLSVSATNSSGTGSATGSFKRNDTYVPEEVIIYYKQTSGVPKIWVWELDGKTISATMGHTWPGSEMTAVTGKTGWYQFVIPYSALSSPIKELHMKFNGGSTEIIRATPVKTGWYNGTAWFDDCPDLPQKPSISFEPAGGILKGTDKITVTITSEIAVTGRTATFGSSSITINSNSIEIPVSTYLANSETKTLSVSATNATGTNTVTGSFKRDDTYTPPENPFSWDNALVYFVMTDRFYNGNPANDTPYDRVKSDAKNKNIGTFHGGDLAGLKAKLEEGYFTNLGVNAIWITAPYEQIHGWVGGGSNGDFAHYGYHGYYVLDYTTVDKNMGTVAELRSFVDAAHDRNIRVVFDIVMNHTGYENLKDMETYGFGSYTQSLSWLPSSGQTFHNWNDFKGTTNWEKWWSSSWVRASFYNNTEGGDLRKCLDFLPDFKTESTTPVAAPPVLKTKWASETSGYTDWINPSAASLRADLNIPPAEYIIKWLAAWVKEFGIDGFRVDTAKHVDMFRWAELKDACSEAYDTWRAANPTKASKIPLPIGKTKGSFWMTGEVWGHGPNKSNYHTDGKFDSIINFNFPTNGDINSIGGVWAGYAASINSDPDFNTLSYISSHDTASFISNRNNLINLGTALVLTPGGSQIYYGDETKRPYGETGSDEFQGTRSDMNWGSIDNTVLTHWQKLGQFRYRHISVGGGSQTDLGNKTYGRIYAKNSVNDKVVIAIGQTGSVQVNVSGVFADGTNVKNFYDNTTGTVAGGKVTFSAGTNGVILVEEVK